MAHARLCLAMAALRSDVDSMSLVSWPSDSEVTVVRVGKQRRRMRALADLRDQLEAEAHGQQHSSPLGLGDASSAGLALAGDDADDPSPSLVNLACMEELDDGLEPLTSWVGSVFADTSP